MRQDNVYYIAFFGPDHLAGVNTVNDKATLTAAHVNGNINFVKWKGRCVVAYWPEILRIIEGGMKLNPDKVSSYAALLAQKLTADGNESVAKRILDVLAQTESSSLRAGSIQGNIRLPLDQDSRLPVADIYPPEVLEQPVVLNNGVRAEIGRFLAYYRESGRLAEVGLDLPYTMLLYGPPGCGKTILAKHIAHEIGLPLVMARLDSLISSFLGSTAKNIRYLFEYVKDHPCVLFLDEFDAVAKLRDDAHELGELKRVVNSLLQNIDGLPHGSILIAATNHEHLLDPAVWRRFTYSLRVDVPDDESRKELINLFMRGRVHDERTFRILSSLFKGLSGAKIEVICTQALREAVLEGADTPGLAGLADAYFAQTVIPQGQSSTDASRIIHLRTLDPKIFSFTVIGEMFGHTRQWAQQQFKRGVSSSAGKTTAD